jgi:hypothetical protein
MYALRFLRASFSLDMGQSQETLIALSQLKVVVNLASGRGDIAVAATACALEALTHINRSNSQDAIEQAQRSLASVRSAQNNPNVAKMPVLIIMAHFVDLMCSLFRDDMEPAAKKLKAMQSSMDQLRDHNSWTFDGTFLVPISQQSARTMPGGGKTYGVVVSNKSEQSYLRMGWLLKEEIYALGFMLSAGVAMNKNPQDKMAERYLRESIGKFCRMPQRKLLSQAVQLECAHPEHASQDLPTHKLLHCHIRVYIVFALCGRNAWGEAKKELNKAKQISKELEDLPTSPINAFILYLEGMIAQGTGDTATALSIYSNPILSLNQQSQNGPRQSPVLRDLSILAAINTVLIVHLPSHPSHNRLPELLAALDGIDKQTQSRNMRGAYSLIRSISFSTQSEILKTKENLTRVLHDAKSTANNQLICLSLNFMTEKFFAGLLGEQAQKSAVTALGISRRGSSELWTSVAEGLLAECLETQGLSTDAEHIRGEAIHIAARLPAAMQVKEEPGESKPIWKGGIESSAR